MKKILASCILVLFFIGACHGDEQVSYLTEGIRYSESVLVYDGGILISNVGADSFSPRDGENKGYILQYKDGKMSTLIPADGRLHMPTGMAVKDHYLYVCDQDELVVYDMNDVNRPPRLIPFAEDDKAVNAVILAGDYLYVTVTNTGRIYRVDVSNPEEVRRPEKWLNVPGPNGLDIDGNTLYVVSIPVDYATVMPENIVYKVDDINNPVLEKFLDVPGLYDGAALSSDRKTLYVSDWKTASITAIDTETRETKVVYQESGIGPADIAVGNGTLYIPDLLNTRIILYPLFLP